MRCAARSRAATPMSDLRFKAAAAGKVDLGAVKEVYPLGDSIALAGVVTADMQASGRMSDIERERYEAIAASGRLTVEGVTAALAGLPEVKVRRAAMSVSPAALTLSELGVTVGRSDIEASGTLVELYRLSPARPDAARAARRPFVAARSQRTAGRRFGGFGDTGAAAAPADTAAMRAVVVPQNLDLALGASLKKILFQKMVLDDFTGSLTVAKGTVSMNRLAMNAFGGRMSASGSYSTAADAQRPALKLKAEIADASFSTTFDQLDVVRRMVPLFEKTGGDYSMSLDLATRLTQTMDPDYATLQADGAIRFEEHPRAEYRRLRPVGRSAQKRRPAPHRGEGCRHPFHDPRRTHRHAALRSERGRYFAQPVGFDGAGSDDRLYGPGDAARRIGGRYSYGGSTSASAAVSRRRRSRST